MRTSQHVISRPEQVHRVRTPDELRQKAKRFMVGHGLSPILASRSERPLAYVSDGRWVCDCDCSNGVSVSPEWGFGVCFECGSEYQPRFPADWQEAEEVLLRRPARNRHYFPGQTALRYGREPETAATLRGENVVHGVGRVG